MWLFTSIRALADLINFIENVIHDWSRLLRRWSLHPDEINDPKYTLCENLWQLEEKLWINDYMRAIKIRRSNVFIKLNSPKSFTQLNNYKYIKRL